jgi:hypothetical protein
MDLVFAYSYEHNHEPSDFINGGEYFEDAQNKISIELVVSLSASFY